MRNLDWRGCLERGRRFRIFPAQAGTTGRRRQIRRERCQATFLPPARRGRFCEDVSSEGAGAGLLRRNPAQAPDSPDASETVSRGPWGRFLRGCLTRVRQFRSLQLSPAQPSAARRSSRRRGCVVEDIRDLSRQQERHTRMEHRVGKLLMQRFLRARPVAWCRCLR